MKTVNISNYEVAVLPQEIKSKIGEKISLRGQIYKIRQMRGFDFVILTLLCQNIQCVCSLESRDKLRENMAVEISALVKEDKRSKRGFELEILAFEPLSTPVELPPFAINGSELPVGIDTLLDYRVLTMRNQEERGIFKIQEGICTALRKFLEQNAFTEIHSPKIVSSGAEGGANIFALDYFGTPAYLAQSPQFYKQMMTGVFGRVYEIAPVFRAEKHHTSRHVNEYTSVDLEMGFIRSFQEIMTMEACMLAFVIEHLKEHYSEYLELLQVKLPVIGEIPQIKFFEAKEILKEKLGFEPQDMTDFEPEEERLLSKYIEEQTGSEFVFVTHYPSSKRPFYAMDGKENREETESFDLLFRGLEITTGGQRIHDYNDQVAKMEARGMAIAGFEHFLSAHKYGLPPHGGLGLGLERLTAQLLGFSNIRRTIMFPRDVNRLEP